MDFIFEIVFELILEGIFGLTIHNPYVKTWAKTMFFLLFSQAVAGFCLWIGIKVGSSFLCIVSAALAAVFLIAAIHGHRNDWKQE